MNRDRDSHPKPTMFSEWARHSGPCPYGIPVERKHFFEENSEFYNAKAKRVKDRDLILMICKEKKWTVKGIE